MFKFTIFLWMGLIAWNLHISLAQPVNCNHSHGALQDPDMQRNKFGDLLTIIGSILLSSNETTPSLYRKEEQPAGIENQLIPMLSKIEIHLGNIAWAVRRSETITQMFNRIGFRYFYKEMYTSYNFYDANAECFIIGGYLAAIRNQKEFDEIIWDVDRNRDYWLGINDLAVEGHYVSIAPNKTAPFLEWKLGEPSDVNHTKNCVAMVDGLMYAADCNLKKYFLCQLDNDI